MNIYRIVLTSFIVTGSTVLFGCSDEAKVRTAAAGEEVKESWDSVKEYTVDKTEDFRDYMSGSLSEMDRKIDGLSNRTGESWNETKAELAVKRDEFAEQIERLGDATADTWQAARDKTVELYEDLRDSVQRAVSQPEA